MLLAFLFAVGFLLLLLYSIPARCTTSAGSPETMQTIGGVALAADDGGCLVCFSNRKIQKSVNSFVLHKQ